MSNKQLTQQEWDGLARDFCKEITRSLTRNHGDVRRIAKLLSLEPGTISDMRKGRSIGSVVVVMRLFFLKAGIPDHEAKKFLDNPQFLIKNLETPDGNDKLYQELKNIYSDNEVAAWLRLLISKRLVEKDLGIEVKARMKKSPKS